MLNVTEKSVKFSYEGDIEKLLKTAEHDDTQRCCDQKCDSGR